MMDDVVRSRVNEILNEKIAMGAGAKRRKVGGARPRKIKPLHVPKSVKVDYDALAQYLTHDEIACIVRNNNSTSCYPYYASAAKKARAGRPEICTKGELGTKDHAKRIRSAIRRGEGYGSGEGGAEGGVSRKASKARKEFAQNSREAAALMSQGYTRQQAWNIIKG